MEEALARSRLRRLGVTEERMDRMTGRQANVEVVVSRVLAEAEEEARREAEWMARASVPPQVRVQHTGGR